jgi:fatty acid desaturase
MTSMTALLIVVATLFCALMFVGAALFLASVAALTLGLRRQHEDETDLTPWQGTRRPLDEENDAQ